jgi:hypothetical protein
LAIIGKTDPQSLKKGILLPQDMPAAIAALQEAVVQEEAHLQEEADAARESGRPLSSGVQGVRLRQRSLPFVRMVERCHAENKEIVWGV